MEGGGCCSLGHNYSLLMAAATWGSAMVLAASTSGASRVRHIASVWALMVGSVPGPTHEAEQSRPGQGEAGKGRGEKAGPNKHPAKDNMCVPK